MGLPWHTSAGEMFVNLNIKSFGELLQVCYTDFVQGLLYLGILCCQEFAIVHVAFIRSMDLVANITVFSFMTGHILIFSKKSLN